MESRAILNWCAASAPGCGVLHRCHTGWSEIPKCDVTGIELHVVTLRCASFGAPKGCPIIHPFGNITVHR